jgi:hypothetical protein
MYLYQEELEANNLTHGDLPKLLKQKIGGIKALERKAVIDPLFKKDVLVLDAEICDEIRIFAERDLPDNEEEQEEIGSQTTKTNNMPTEAQKALMLRAKAVGLPETATEAQVSAAEKKIADDNASNEAKAAADKKAAEDKAAADAKAAEDAKNAAAKAAAEADILDDLDL